MDAKLHALILWQALQHAPLPYWHTRPSVTAGYTLTADDAAWLSAYQHWFFGLRRQSMRGLPDISPIERVVELERENERLRRAVAARTWEEFLKDAPLVQEDIF